MHPKTKERLNEGVRLLRLCASAGPYEYLPALAALQTFTDSLPEKISGQTAAEFLIAQAGFTALQEFQAQGKFGEAEDLIQAICDLRFRKDQLPAAARSMAALQPALALPTP